MGCVARVRSGSWRVRSRISRGGRRRFGAAGRRVRSRAGVDWAKPVAPATSRGPQPVSRRQAQIRSAKLGREQPRRASRSARAIEQRLGAPPAIDPAMPPAVSGRRRDLKGGRGRSHRRTLLDPGDERKPTSQAELGVRVHEHPSPSSRVRPARPTRPRRRAGLNPQTFTTSLGRTSTRDSYAGG